MDSLFGLPAHPLLVHVPVVLLPLAALGVVVMAVKVAWHERYRWAVLAIGVVGALGAWLAASAGEAFEDTVEAQEGPEAARRWQDHEENGEAARNAAVLFAVVLIAFVLVPWFLERRRARAGTAPLSPSVERGLRIGVAALVILAAIGSGTTIVIAGHSGADAVWAEYDAGG